MKAVDRLTDSSAQSPQLKAALAGQIARALAVFCVDEVVVFNDGQFEQRSNSVSGQDHSHQNQADAEWQKSYTGYSNPDYFLAHILSYLETPPHLRKHLFPMHPDLQLAGSLPSLDMPHHLRANEWCLYREGVTVEGSQPINGASEEASDRGKERKKKKINKKTAPESPSLTTTTLVDCGLPQPTSIAGSIPPNTRVTLKFTDEAESSSGNPSPSAEAVSPSTPRSESGYFWGYSVRPASSLSAVFTECPFPDGYDVTFGTSERGLPLSTIIHPPPLTKSKPIPEFNHMLITFGGVAGLEAALKADAELNSMGVKKVEELFDFWVNLCPGQGSRTVRTEEAVWLGLMGLKDVVLTKGRGR